MSIFSAIGLPLGWIMHYIYEFVGNYGITLLIFTLIIRVIFIPISINQQKGMVTMAKIKPKLDDLQKKYGNNKEKLNQETMALYNREKYSPLSSCLPALLQFAILFGVIDVIYYPLKHILRLPEDAIAKATEIATTVLGADNMSRYSSEISIINAVKQSPDAFASLDSSFVEAITNFKMNFLGIDLGITPTLFPSEGQAMTMYLMLLAIPVLSGLVSLTMSTMTMRNTPTAAGQQGAAMNSMMMFMMPLMSLYISFQVPAGVGLYWLMSNSFQTIQTFILNKVMNPREMARIAKEEAEEELRKEKEEKAEARKKAREEKEINGVPEKSSKSQKEINRERLAAARKRDAEKYGEEYTEVTDKDMK